jgi:hypothetical protein
MRRLFLILPIFFTVTATYAQSPTPAPLPLGLSQADAYIKIVVAVVTGIATLLGLPIVFLTYRKTRAEITKIELEANALRSEQALAPNQSKDQEGNIRIVVDRSPHASIQVLADPRFLAPLLLLLDFIFAWAILTLVGYFLSIFGFGSLSDLALALLAGVLLLPIARQVIRVRSVLRPPRTPEEIRASSRQARVAGIAVYLLCIVSSMSMGIFFLSLGSLTEIGRYLAWTLIGASVLMIVLAWFAKSRFERFLAKTHETDVK